jgi:hypothetical protein
MFQFEGVCDSLKFPYLPFKRGTGDFKKAPMGIKS